MDPGAKRFFLRDAPGELSGSIEAVKPGNYYIQVKPPNGSDQTFPPVAYTVSPANRCRSAAACAQLWVTRTARVGTWRALESVTGRTRHFTAAFRADRRRSVRGDSNSDDPADCRSIDPAPHILRD